MVVCNPTNPKFNSNLRLLNISIPTINLGNNPIKTNNEL
jgi:hypothetical protein